jgi:uncharacterized membrane protein
VKIHSETNGKLNGTLKLSNKGSKIAVAVVVIFVFSLLVGYYFFSRLPPEGYSTMYLLDYPQKKAVNYPELLVSNQNSTFNVWVVVENHMGTRQSYEVLQKVVAGNLPSFPVEADVENSYAQTIENGDDWQTLATVTINEPGSYSVIFELWIHDETGELVFSNNYCVLNIEVVGQL